MTKDSTPHLNPNFLETEDNYHQLIELLPDAVFFADIRGRLLYVNPAGAELVGAANAKELLGRSVWSLMHPDSRVRARERSQQLKEGVPVRLVEQTLLKLDGSQIPVETVSVPVRFGGRPAVLCTARDLTGRKRMEEELLESRELFEKAFQLGPAAISITRLSDGCFIDANDEFFHLTGFKREEIIGKTWEELGISDTTDDQENGPPYLIINGDVHDVEAQLQTKGGDRKIILVSVQRIQLGGEPSVLAVFTDVTERKLAENELRVAKEQAEEMARIKSAFLTNMTHEVRTPLTVILGFTSMLRQGVKPQYQRFVRVIERSGRRLLLMLDSILDLAQLEAGTVEIEREPFNVVEVTRTVSELLKSLAEEKGLSFELVIREQDLFAREGRKLVMRILNNLLDNAVKFTEQGTIQLSVTGDDKMVYLVIRDSGIGIEDHFLPRVFDEFTQESTGLERAYQGSGLGLSVSKRLVELIGGSILVSSNKGQGSVFTVALPRATAVN